MFLGVAHRIRVYCDLPILQLLQKKYCRVEIFVFAYEPSLLNTILEASSVGDYDRLETLIVVLSSRRTLSQTKIANDTAYCVTIDSQLWYCCSIK